MTAEQIGRDKITYGDVEGSYNAIGAGAQVLVNNIYQALSAIAELEQEERFAERKLAESIEALINRYQSSLEEVKNNRDASNPYKALLDYRLKDAPYFFGRENAIQDLLDKTKENPLTILNSASGSGKTSIMKAGLAARLLADGHLPLYLRPFDLSPHLSIKQAFLPDYDNLPELQRFRDMSLMGFLGRVTRYLGDKHLYIFLDQFEEFFTRQKQEDQAKFALELRGCIEAGLPIHWVLALRKEYFSDLRVFEGLNPFGNEFFLETFDLAEAQEVISKPADLKQVNYESGLITQIIDDLKLEEEERVAPAQVQLVCHTLFEELSHDEKTITFDLYNQKRGRAGSELPGAKGILNSHLTRVLDKNLDGEHRDVAMRLLEELVTSEKRRDRVAEAKLHETLGTTFGEELINQVLHQLDAARLIRKEQDAEKKAVYELTHDYLLEEIQVDPQTLQRKAAQELLDSEIRAYQQHKTLLSEQKYNIINSQRGYLSLDETAEELLDKSQQKIAEGEAEERRKQRVQTAAIMLAGGIIIAIILVVFAFYQRNNAVVAQGQAEKAEATAVVALEEVEVQRDAAATAEADAVAARVISDVNAQLASTREAEAVVARETAVVAQEEAEVAKDETEQLKQSIQASQLAAASEAVVPVDKELALILAVASLGIANQSDTQAAYYQAIYTAYRRTFDRNGGKSVRVSPNGKYLVMSDWSNAKVFDISDGTLLSIIRYPTDSLWVVDFSPNGEFILTAGIDGEARLWDADNGTLILTLPPEAGQRGSQTGDRFDREIYSADFSPDGEKIVTGRRDGMVTVWDADGGMQFLTLTGHTGLVWSIDFSPDGKTIITASGDRTAKLWNANDGTLLRTLEHADQVLSAGFSPDGKTIITANGKTARLWDADNNTLLFTLEGHTDTLTFAGFSPDGNSIVTTSEDGTAKLWDVDDGALLLTLGGHTNRIYSAAFSLDGDYIFTLSEDALEAWDANYGREKLTIPLNTNEVAYGSFTLDEETFAVSSWWGSIMLDTRNGFEIFIMPQSVASYSPDGKKIFTVSEYNTVSIWNSEGDTLLSTLEGHASTVQSVNFSPDGKVIVTTSDDRTAKLWDADSGELLRTLRGHENIVWLANFSPDGKVIVTASEDGTAKLWDADSGELLRTLRGHENMVWSANFSPDGESIITASHDRTAKVWNANSGALLLTLDDHIDVLSYADFSPDGKALVTASWDHTAKVWDAADGTLLHTIVGHTDALDWASFSPDGELIITASRDGTVRVWGFSHSTPTLESKIAVARERISRGFTEAECNRYFRDELERCPRTVEELFALFEDG